MFRGCGCSSGISSREAQARAEHHQSPQKLSRNLKKPYSLCLCSGAMDAAVASAAERHRRELNTTKALKNPQETLNLVCVVFRGHGCSSGVSRREAQARAEHHQSLGLGKLGLPAPATAAVAAGFGQHSAVTQGGSDLHECPNLSDQFPQQLLKVGLELWVPQPTLNGCHSRFWVRVVADCA